MLLPADLRQFGVIPRNLDSLWGIAAMPLLHVDAPHLLTNCGVLLVLLMVSFSYDQSLALTAIIFIWILSGGMVWLFGKGGTVHIGASGIIFGLIGFLMFLGLFRRDWKAVLISIVITVLYGGALYSLLLYIPGTSWSGHFFGFLSGVLVAWRTQPESKRSKRKRR
jgi:membrane associated rhomboid family serine protease